MQVAYVYILANKRNGTLYPGMSSAFDVRIAQHMSAKGGHFAKKYGCNMLVYYEECGSIMHAREREHLIKAGSRKKKLALIESVNPEWKDLATENV